MALQTIGHQHRDLRQISIHVPLYLTIIRSYEDVGEVIGAGILEQWLGLDRTLVRLWESHSIRTRFFRPRRSEKVGVVDCIGSLLPEMTRRGRIELVED